MKIYMVSIELSVDGFDSSFYEEYFTDEELAYECRRNFESAQERLIKIAEYLKEFFSIEDRTHDSRYSRRFWLFYAIKPLIMYHSSIRFYDIDITGSTKVELKYFDF